MPPEGRRSNSHAVRAARMDTRELDARLRRWEADQRTARAGIEAELRREHWGHLPDGWGQRGD